MVTVQPCEIPRSATLRAVQENGAFADCYATDVRGTVSQAEFVEVFYTTTLFKVERKLLAWFAAKPATNSDAARLGNGTATSFSAWTVESRSEDQLLLADFTGRTKSWLMVAHLGNSQTGEITRLYETHGKSSNSHSVSNATTPNPSLKRSANVRPSGPVWRYAVHFRQPGPAVLPSSPA